MSDTQSIVDSADDPASIGSPAVYRLLACDRPLAGSSRHALTGLDGATIGRTPARVVQRRGGTLTLGVEDKSMSSAHARLVRDGRRWMLEDAGSRNGVMLNGERIERQALVDGDVFELGETLWLYRTAAPATVLDLDDEALPEPLPGLRTFVPALAEAYEALAKIVAIDVPILLHAESGTGKELCAKAVHRLAGRSGAFIAVNCGALPATLATSELFGYRKGAFSGADEDRAGLVRGADKGTLFLDEIADLPMASQTLLLRALQEREVTPLGATRPVPVDVKVVAASHRDLKTLVKQELFRHDLYARLAGYSARILPLRERREDFGLLIAALLERAPHGRTARLTTTTARALLDYSWPLNVRELENCLTVASTLAEGGTIHRKHLAEDIVEAAAAPEDDTQDRKAELIALLREHQGNISAISKATGKSRMQLHRWLKRYELDPNVYRNK